LRRRATTPTALTTGDCRGRPLASLVLSACCLTRPISQKGPLLASGSFVQKEAAKSKIKADEIAGR